MPLQPHKLLEDPKNPMVIEITVFVDSLCLKENKYVHKFIDLKPGLKEKNLRLTLFVPDKAISSSFPLSPPRRGKAVSAGG